MMPGKKLLVSMLVLVALVAFISASVAAPKRVPTAKGSDCAACHGQEKVLSPSHADTKGMTYTDCLGCHDKAGPQKLTGKLPGSHVHQLKGMTCDRCHEKGKKPEAVPMDTCVKCHNPDKLVEKTAKVKPENPHTSPHYGNTLDCNACHHQHQKSEDFCAQCHKFNFKTP